MRWLCRWWCGFWLAIGARVTSSKERMLERDVETLSRDLHQRDTRIRELEADVKVLTFETKQLAAVNARDLQRVKAETQAYSDKIAQGA